MDIARKVSKDHDYLRVDFLSCGTELYANEITIYPNAGLTRAQPQDKNDLNEMTSAKWDIGMSHFMRNKQEWPLELYRRILARRSSRKL